MLFGLGFRFGASSIEVQCGGYLVEAAEDWCPRVVQASCPVDEDQLDPSSLCRAAVYGYGIAYEY